MTKKNKVLSTVVHELSTVGIKPKVYHTARHIEVSWVVGDVKRNYIVASTPSDHRAYLNARADIRRKIKHDYKLIEKDRIEKMKNDIALAHDNEKKLFHAAFSPKQTTIEQRLDRIENDVKAMIDLFLEFSKRENGNRENQVKKEEIVIIPPPPKKKYEMILDHLSMIEWTPVRNLVKIFGPSTNTFLNYLKAKDLVENRRGFWKRKIP